MKLWGSFYLKWNSCIMYNFLSKCECIFHWAWKREKCHCVLSIEHTQSLPPPPSPKHTHTYKHTHTKCQRVRTSKDKVSKKVFAAASEKKLQSHVMLAKEKSRIHCKTNFENFDFSRVFNDLIKKFSRGTSKGGSIGSTPFPEIWVQTPPVANYYIHINHLEQTVEVSISFTLIEAAFRLFPSTGLIQHMWHIK